jgi:hypothetical protein
MNSLTKKNGAPKIKSVLLRLPLSLVQSYQRKAHKLSAEHEQTISREKLMWVALAEWIE